MVPTLSLQPELLETKPQKLKYPSSKIKYKHYGKIAEDLIKKAKEYKDGDEKDALVESIAGMMKKIVHDLEPKHSKRQVIIRRHW